MKFRNIVLITTLLSLPNLSFGAVGNIVADPTSHTHFIRSLQQDEKLFRKAVAQAQSLKKLSNDIYEYQTELEAVYEVLDIMSIDHETMSKIMNKIDVATIMAADGITFDFDNPATFRDIINVNVDGLFVDPADAQLSWTAGKRTAGEIQRIFKEALIESRSDMLITKVELEKQASLSKEIGKTKNLKDAAALTNSYLDRLLETNLRISSILARMEEMEAASMYVGTPERFIKVWEYKSNFKKQMHEALKKEGYWVKKLHDAGKLTYEEMSTEQRSCFTGVEFMDNDRCRKFNVGGYK